MSKAAKFHLGRRGRNKENWTRKSRRKQEKNVVLKETFVCVFVFVLHMFVCACDDILLSKEKITREK